jgi:hypothetical protein
LRVDKLARFADLVVVAAEDKGISSRKPADPSYHMLGAPNGFLVT